MIDVANFTRFPNWLLDEAMPNCDSSEWAILCVVVRKTIGWNKGWQEISISDFSKLSGIKGRQNITRAIKSLLDKGYLDRRPDGQAFVYTVSTSNESLLVTKDNQSRFVTSASNESLLVLVTKDNQLPPTERKERKDKDIAAPEAVVETREPLQDLERHFEQYAGILAGRSNYTEDWERPLQIILNGTDVETAKKKITSAIDFIRASKGTNKQYTLRAPLSLLTIIANMPADTGVPQNTIRVRTR